MTMWASTAERTAVFESAFDLRSSALDFVFSGYWGYPNRCPDGVDCGHKPSIFFKSSRVFLIDF